MRWLGWKTLHEKIYRSQSTNQSAELNERLPDLCFAICRFSHVRFITRATSRTISFSISNSFGINLIHFSDGKNNRTGQNLIICLGFSITRRAARAIQERESEQSGRIFLATESGNCEFQRHNGETGSVKGDTKTAVFWQGKVWTHSNCANFWHGKV